ncbi:MAG: helix-turn-helix domain-containing protein [Planctomycetota bacterium]
MGREVDYERMSVFEQVMAALQEGLAHARGKRTLKTTVLFKPAPKLSKTRVISIRKLTGMTQSTFASFLNVPTNTLQNWEQGTRVPKSAEARLLQVIEIAPGQIMAILNGEPNARTLGK